MHKPEIEPRKERRASAVWMIAALLVFLASVLIVIGAYRNTHAPVAGVVHHDASGTGSAQNRSVDVAVSGAVRGR
jgi:hypothetical protein